MVSGSDNKPYFILKKEHLAITFSSTYQPLITMLNEVNMQQMLAKKLTDGTVHITGLTPQQQSILNTPSGHMLLLATIVQRENEKLLSLEQNYQMQEDNFATIIQQEKNYEEQAMLFVSQFPLPFVQ